jgi:hypothetical protein
MKTYIAPTIVVQGDVTQLTRGLYVGTRDPNGISMDISPGSAGFSL